MEKVSPETYARPVPSALVFHPEKIREVLVRLPVFPSTVTVEPEVYGVVGSDGWVPPVCPLPLYAMVGRHVPEYPLHVRNGYPPCVPEQIDHVVPVETPLPGLTPLVMGQLRLSES
jgi:hypothetical protein